MISDEIKGNLTVLKAEIESCEDEQALRNIHAKILGRKGLLKDLMGHIKDVANENKRAYGEQVNQIKKEFTQLLKEKQDKLVNSSIQKSKSSKTGVDLLIPLEKMPKGTLHPLSIVEQEIVKSFKGMGFSIVGGPEMETDHYNFEALNIPKEHPARDMQDTFWLVNNWLLRTHTSPCQVRAMKRYGAPLKIIAPGRTFRNEALDASHENTFHQVEGLVVGENISIAHLIYVMKTLLSEVFKKEVKVRLRPGYFPFVEPGFELDLQCIMCGGSGCKTCSYSGWIELVPCGMVHRNVLEMSNIDPDKYTGFAFGLGISRLVMMKYNIPDIRTINRADLRELKQFHTQL